MPKPEGPEKPVVGTVVADYWDSLRAYRQFLDLMRAALSDYPAKHDANLSAELNQILTTFAQVAKPEELKELAGAFDKMAQVMGPGREQQTKEAGEAGSGVTEVQLQMGPRAASTMMRLFKAIRAQVPAERHQDILYRGILTGLVSQFEVLVADIGHQFFRVAPAAAGSTEKVLSVSELLSFASTEEAVEYVIADKVDDLLRGSPEEWRKFFQSRMNLDLAELSSDWDVFSEYIQRRHLIVHAGGRISRRYLRNVSKELVALYFGTPDVGQIAVLTDDYIKKALESFESTGVVFGLAAWSKLKKEERDDQASLLDEILYEALLARNWTTAYHLASWGKDQAQFDASYRLTFQMNQWLALKRLGRWQECHQEVEQFDSSAYKPIYEIAREALLGNMDRLFKLIDLHGASGFDERAWDEWPILEEMRQDPRFSTYRDKYSPRRPIPTRPLRRSDQAAAIVVQTDKVDEHEESAEAESPGEGSAGNLNADSA